MSNDPSVGVLDPAAASSAHTSQVFVMQQLLAKMHIAQLVQVVAVTNAGGVAPVGTVDVRPLVSQLDANGVAVDHNTIYQIPYFRLQGGSDAVILDPKVGDIGLAVFADRDISQVKANGAASLPGSHRRNDMADGLYFGGFLNGTPSQYVQFTAGGINVVSPSKVTITAPVTEVDSSTQIALNAPNIILNGNVSQGAGSYAGTSTWAGDLNTQGALTNKGHDVGATHKHLNSGGSGLGGVPQ